MTRPDRDDRDRGDRNISLGDGSSYHEGIAAQGDVTIEGDVDLSISASTTSTSHESTVVVAALLRDRVDELLATLAAEGFAGERALAAASVLRQEVDRPRVIRRRIQSLLTSIETSAGQITAVATAVDLTRRALGH